MKILNIDEENLHIFWTTWGISMKFSGKIWLMIILKVTTNQGFTPSLEDTILEKTQGGGGRRGEGGRVKLTSPSLLRVKHKCIFIWCSYHFNIPFCIILQYLQSKKETLCQKEKQYSVRLHDFFSYFMSNVRGSIFIKGVSQWI